MSEEIKKYGERPDLSADEELRHAMENSVENQTSTPGYMSEEDQKRLKKRGKQFRNKIPHELNKGRQDEDFLPPATGFDPNMGEKPKK